MKKIAFLSRYQDSEQRGAEVFVAELTRRLKSQFEVEILSGSNADSLTNILQGKYDLVIPINGRFQVLKVSLGRLIGGYKVIISGHSGIGRDDIWNLVIGSPDIFVALTSRMESWAKSFSWRSKIVKIPNGVDLQKFTSSGKRYDLSIQRPVILSVGALVWYKQHELAIEAVARMSKGSLVIVGEGPLKSKLENLGRSKLGDRFKVLKIDYEDIPKVYRSADVFTLPSWDREAFGIVYLEALASGIPVVAPNDESRKEIVGDGGILVNVSDAIEYSKALEEAFNHNWGDSPVKQARKFDWDQIAKKYAQLFHSVLGS